MYDSRNSQFNQVKQDGNFRISAADLESSSPDWRKRQDRTRREEAME